MSEAWDAIDRAKLSYLKLDGPDRILFWVHFLVAPSIIAGAAAWAFGVGPTLLFLAGGLLWLGSRA